MKVEVKVSRRPLMVEKKTKLTKIVSTAWLVSSMHTQVLLGQSTPRVTSLSADFGSFIFFLEMRCQERGIKFSHDGV